MLLKRIYSPPATWPALASMAGIVLCAMVLGTLAQLASPFRIPWIEDHGLRLESLAAAEGIEIASSAEMRRHMESGSLLILDARSAKEFDTGHLPGALSFPFATHLKSFTELSAILEPSQPVIVYCSGRHCDDALRLGIFLKSQGTQKVILFPGGVAEWTRAGFSLE